MTTTTLIGYGQFHLEDFHPGEQFARFDGSLGHVCKEQPFLQPQPQCNHPFLPDHVWVWINDGTSNALRTFLHRRAIVHAVTPEQARTIEHRLHQPKGARP
jgi:hypothetical protein